MFGKIFTCAVLLILTLSACSTPPPRWRQESNDLLEKVRMEDGETLLPAEFKSAEDVLLHGVLFLENDDCEQAESYFRLAFAKLTLLEKNLAAEKMRLQQEMQRREEAEKAALARQKAEEEEHKAVEEKKKADTERSVREALAQRAAEKARQLRERPQTNTYTVRRGQSLPLIAAQPEVYNDRNLWPLIYRANRDQISDPHHIWPGQVLRIPRNLNREDISEARRYAQEKNLH